MIECRHTHRIGCRVLAVLCLTTWTTLAAADTPSDKLGERREQEAIAEQIRRESYTPSGEWEAYFRDADGFSYTMIQPMEQNPDEDWLGLQFTPFSGPRSRIAVMRVENETAEVDGGVTGVIRDFVAGESEVPLAAIEELLMAAIFNTHRFDVVERQQIETVMSEQDFGTGGRVTEQSAAAIGRLLGAQYMLFTAVNEWTPKKKVVSSIGKKIKVAEVAISVRIVEVDSSRVTYARTFRATAEDSDTGVAPVFSITSRSPVNYAVTSCLNKAAYDIANSLRNVTWSGSVVKVDGSTVTINAGSRKGMREGITLTALSAGEELIDPETGESLGSDTETIGTIRVTAVHDAYSKAEIVEGCKGLKAGDRLEYAHPR